MNKQTKEIINNPVLRLLMSKKQIEELVQLMQQKNNRTPDCKVQED